MNCVGLVSVWNTLVTSDIQIILTCIVMKNLGVDLKHNVGR